MFRKLEECKNCSGWNEEENRMRNRLRCMVGCEARQLHQTQIAIAYNRVVGGSPTEHGNRFI